MSGDQRPPRETGDLTAVSTLLAAMPDPAAASEHWRRICRDMVTRASAREYERGQADGYLLAIADFKAWQHGAVKDAELERRQWHLCCRRCRLGGHRADCRDCENRARSTFSRPAPGDYPGRGSVAA